MDRTARRTQAGFTLVELLAVIAVLGTLSGVVVISVGAVRDHASSAACEADARTITTAEQAALSTTGAYLSEADLVSSDLLSAASDLHDVVLADGGFTVVPVGDCAGDGGELAEGDDDLGEEVGAEDQLSDEERKRAEAAAEEEAERKAAEQAAAEEEARKQAEQATPAENADGGEGGDAACEKGQIDINSASKKELREIEHVGGDEATRIEKQRPFTSLGQLVEVKGLDEDEVKDIIAQGVACASAA